MISVSFLAVSPSRLQAQTSGEAVYYFHNDHLGSPIKMTDSSGTVVWTWQYGPFREEPLTMEPNTINQNLRFPGQYYDAETGLSYNYFRYYQSGIGRYLTPDPALSISGLPDIPYLLPKSLNLPQVIGLYIYVINNPMRFMDLFGLRCRSGQCEDCPTGVWSTVGMGFGGGFFVENTGIFGTTNIRFIRCASKNIDCLALITCRAKQGVAISLGYGGGGGICRGMPCKEDLQKEVLGDVGDMFKRFIWPLNFAQQPRRL